jgi:hypothetical protein
LFFWLGLTELLCACSGAAPGVCQIGSSDPARPPFLISGGLIFFAYFRFRNMGLAKWNAMGSKKAAIPLSKIFLYKSRGHV